jgi:hypothetical protein
MSTVILRLLTSRLRSFTANTVRKTNLITKKPPAKLVVLFFGIALIIGYGN